MRRSAWLALAGAFLIALALGWYGRGLFGAAAPADTRRSDVAAGEGPCAGGAEPLYWKAPMDPTYVRDEPGKSPMGMDLVPVCPGEDAQKGPGIRIDPAVLQNIGVRTVLAERRDLAREVRAVGRVAYDERLVSHVHTKVQGWIEKLYVEYEGQQVERGQPLLEIYSPELVSTQEEILQAARYRDLTKESPFSDVAKGGETLLEVSKRRLQLWDIPDRDIRRLLETGKVRESLTLYAPAPGVVVELMARDGMEVGPAMNLYTLADLSRVWVYADVYEYELPWIKVGQPGRVELSYLPGEVFEGEVTYVYPFLDPETRTARVRLELPNPGMVLKPDMYANVTIETDLREDVLAVPDEAVLRSGKRSLIVAALGDGRFAPREVTTGIESGNGWIEVRRGLDPGERVVTSGQFLIDSESRLREAVQKLLSPEDADGGGVAGGGEGRAMPEGAMEHSEHDMAEPGVEHSGHPMPEGGMARPERGKPAGVPELEMEHDAPMGHGPEETGVPPAAREP